MVCKECDSKVTCIESSDGPVAMGHVWWEDGWHVHYPEGFVSVQVFECSNGHKHTEKWVPSCPTCSQKSK